MTNKIEFDAYQPYRRGLLAATIMFAPCAPSAAQGRAAITSEFSAQQQQDKDKKESGPGRAPGSPHGQLRREQLRAWSGATAHVAHSQAAESHIARGQAAEGDVACGQAAESHIAHRQTTKGYVARS